MHILQEKAASLAAAREAVHGLQPRTHAPQPSQGCVKQFFEFVRRWATVSNDIKMHIC